MYKDLKDLEIEYGNLRDSMSLHVTLQESAKQHAFYGVVFKATKLIVELLFFIIRRQH